MDEYKYQPIEKRCKCERKVSFYRWKGWLVCVFCNHLIW
jgi:hypothetical protein